MPKSKSQRMKEYRARKKAQLGDEWFRRESERVMGYFVPVAELTEVQKVERQEKNRVLASKHRQRKKKRTSETNEPQSSTLPPTNENIVSSTTDLYCTNENRAYKVKMCFKKNHTAANCRVKGVKTKVSRALNKQYKLNAKLLQRNREMETKLRTAQQKLRRWERKENNRLPSTPQSKTMKLLKDAGVNPSEVVHLKKKLLFAECVAEEIKQASKSINTKKYVMPVVTGKIVKKYRLKSTMGKYTQLNRRTMKEMKLMNLGKRINSVREKIMSDIQIFLERDDNSRMLPGKADAVKIEKKKIQKRVLNDYMHNLHHKFLSESTYRISLATFCRARPSHIALVNFSSKSVCLCNKHQNFALKLRCLKDLKVTKCTSPDKFLETHSDSDLDGILDQVMKTTTTVKYREWRRVKLADGKEKMRIVEAELPSNEFVKLMKESRSLFADHVRKVITQYKALKEMKERLSPSHVLIQMDFAENYCCQNMEEIQSAYWNATAVTLHPTVIYYRREDGELNHKSTIVVSEVLQHNAPMVLAVISKIMAFVKQLVGRLEAVHFWTDSPTSQYRNKTIFDLVRRFHAVYGVRASWQYFEAGHGKGPCDGLGGSSKRQADNAVKREKAIIQDADDFFAWATTVSTSVEYMKISLDEFENSRRSVESRNRILKPVKGTMKIHAVFGNGSGTLHTRETTCACEKCFSDSGFDDGGCGWNKHIVREDTAEDETKEAKIQVKQGDFVVCNYEGRRYLGQIVDTDDDDLPVEVNFLQPSSKMSGLFVWPKETDRIWLRKDDILKLVLDLAPTGKSRRAFKASDELLEYLDFS